MDSHSPHKYVQDHLEFLQSINIETLQPDELQALSQQLRTMESYCFCLLDEIDDFVRAEDAHEWDIP